MDRQGAASDQATKETDDGTLRLKETPTNYFVRSTSTRHSAQALAQAWLDQNYEMGNLTIVEYQTRIHELKQAIRLGVDSAASCTDAIIASLRRLNSCGWLVGRWHFVSVDCDHFASEAWETNFACCYRNAQTMLSALFRLPEFRKRLFGSLSAMPSVWKLQALLEAAWASGFDPAGAAQIAEVTGRTSAMAAAVAAGAGSKPAGLVDSTVWLGATDLAALLGSVGVRCCLVECTATSGPRNTHPKLLQHIYSYIRASEHSDLPPEMAPLIYSLPMYLQHEGHSRIVIGVQVDELTEEPIALMVLDPNIAVHSMRLLSRAAAAAASAAQASDGATGALATTSTTPVAAVPPAGWTQVLAAMRVESAQLNQPQYQLLQMDGLINDEMDLQDAMIPENIAIAIS